jgi:methylmalonyl-CoA/ethylmalonyl-CoA epimerase
MKFLRWLVLPCIFVLGLYVGESRAQKEQQALVDSKVPHQVAIICQDVEKSAKEWAALFGVETPKWSITQSLDEANTRYRGKPTEGRAKLAFIHLDNISIELIEPVGSSSTWREHLDEQGESAHHLAFRIKDLEAHIQRFEKAGMPLIQRGQWTTGKGGRYAYMDSYKQLGLSLELIESGLK